MNEKEQREKAIKDFREPPFPYVAFIARKIVSKDGVRRIVYKPFVLAIGAHHADPFKIDGYLGKPGWSIFKYRLPTEKEKAKLSDPFRGTTNFGEDVEQWATLEHKIKTVTGRYEARVQELESENQELEAKVARLIARNKTKAKDDGERKTV